jgi:transcriptional regulator with GAF, ATPase, and Fis domain
VATKVHAGDAVWISNVNDLPDRIRREMLRGPYARAAAVLPLAPVGGDGALYGMTLSSLTRERDWAPAIRESLHLLAPIIGQALEHRAGYAALHDALGELQRLRRRPDHARDVVPPRSRTGASHGIVAESRAIRQALAQVELVAPTNATVLLLGETGVGKEVFARAIHQASPQFRRAMVPVNCAALPAALAESELFGRERGAYTDAVTGQIGRFEAAHNSTLFLDEVGELSADVQVKLLRVLQDKVIERLGSTQSIKVNVRIIAATNSHLEQAVRNGSFREDLLYRLNVFPITIPPLRERIADIPGLVWAFVDEISRAFGKPIETISSESMEELQRYPWPGNVRELRNIIERAVILATGRHLVVPVPRQTPARPAATKLVDREIEHIRAVLESVNWRVRGLGGAAERLGIKPTTLESRMARLGIVREELPV